MNRRMRTGLLCGAAMVLLFLPGLALARAPKGVPAYGTQRLCGYGIQMNPVVSGSGGIAYSTWDDYPYGWGYHGAVWRDYYRDEPIALYGFQPGDTSKCINLAGSLDSLVCTLYETDDSGYTSKVVYKGTVTDPILRPAIHWGRHSLVSIWDDGAPNHRIRVAASKFEDGNWFIRLVGNPYPSTDPGFVVDIQTDGNQDEPAAGRDFVAWVEHRPWEEASKERVVSYAHESNGYASTYELGYGRHPSAGSSAPDGVSLLAFEEYGSDVPKIAVYEILGPGSVRRVNWEPRCAVARRPVLGREGNILYSCWDPDRKSWDLHLSNVYSWGSACSVFVDSLGYLPDEDEVGQYHITSNFLVYSKLDNPASMQFGVWFNHGEALETLWMCRGYEEEYGYPLPTSN